MWASSHSDWPSTGHSDLYIDEQPHPKKSHLHSVNWSPFRSALVIFHPLDLCNQRPPYTHPPSHPRTCIHSPLPGRTDNWSLFLLQQTTPKSLSIYNHIYTSNSELPFSILTSEPNIITIQQLPWSVSPHMPSHSMPWSCTTLQQTSHDVIGLTSNVMCNTTENDDWWSPAIIQR